MLSLRPPTLAWSLHPARLRVDKHHCTTLCYATMPTGHSLFKARQSQVSGQRGKPHLRVSDEVSKPWKWPGAHREDRTLRRYGR